MTFNDLFKSSILENITSFSALDMGIAMGFAFIVGLFIFFVYQKTYTGVMYSSSFGISLIAMAMITTLIILAISSNIILSLGMVGALSIVRFRSAIKEPLDIVFLFWAVAAGIVLGAGFLPLAILSSLFIGIVLVLLANKKSVDAPYILIISSDNEVSEEALLQQISAGVKKHSIKAKTISDCGMEFTFEVRLNGDSTGFIKEIKRVAGVRSAALVSYNGDYMS
ncbi:MAG: DUF4956 domain-containing protein [Eubacteriales bacterium]|nr:DUF4956 domain-containing protein [Eubacteriales bacterium]MDD4389546.1 DUF4956 domain-containing protein [Eubacteriales bacterium]